MHNSPGCLPYVDAVVVGPQCSGKGWVSAILAEALGLHVISTGQIYRDEMDSGSEFGREVARLLADGGICPDEMTNSVSENAARLALLQGKRVAFDGYPRSQAQLDHLEARFEVGAWVVMMASKEGREAAAHARGRWDDALFEAREATYVEKTAPMVARLLLRSNALAFNTLEGVDDARTLVEATRLQIAGRPWSARVEREPWLADPESEEPKRLLAPFTDGEVAALNAWQERGDVHPFTCAGDRKDEAHRAHQAAQGGDFGQLVAETMGWRCPVEGCPWNDSVVQAWAWSFMARGPNPSVASPPPIPKNADTSG